MAAANDDDVPLGSKLENWKLMRRDDSGEGGFFLLPSSPDWEAVEVFVEVPRSAESPSLGIMLDELFCSDEAGLVVVEGLVEGGNGACASPPLLPGDALAKAGLPGQPLVSIEGRSFDATIDFLGSLDASAGGVILAVKRLVKRPSLTLTVRFPESEEREDATIKLYKGSNLRRSMLSNGIQLNDPLARRFDAGIGTGDCGGEGCCCTCALEVESGGDVLNNQKTQEAQMLRRFPRWRLGCKAVVESLEEDREMAIKVQPRGFDGFYGEEECDIDGVPLKRG
jgi:ferredoxin